MPKITRRLNLSNSVSEGRLSRSAALEAYVRCDEVGLDAAAAELNLDGTSLRDALREHHYLVELKPAEQAAWFNYESGQSWVRGKYEESASLAREVIRIRERVFGTDHWQTADGLRNLAVIYNQQRKYKEAEELYLRALAIRERIPGFENADLEILAELARMYRATGRNADAEALDKRAERRNRGIKRSAQFRHIRGATRDALSLPNRIPSFIRDLRAALAGLIQDRRQKIALREIDRLTEKSRDLRDNQAHDLLNLMQRGFVGVEGKGISISRIEITLLNRTRRKLLIRISPGTYFISRGAHQNMVITSEETIRLSGCTYDTVNIRAACINAARPVPKRTDFFGGAGQVPSEVARFLGASLGEDQWVIQAGVWALTDRYTRQDAIGRLKSTDEGGVTTHPISEHHCTRAKAILDSLGIRHYL